MHDTSDFRRGLRILHEGIPWEVIDFQHVKMQMRKALVRTKMRNMLTGSVLERNFQSGEKFPPPDLQFRKMQYLYPEQDAFVFMDMESYDQINFTAEQLGDTRVYLKENTDVDVVFFEGRPISVALPNHMVLTVAQTEPGMKGDTVTGGSKPATLETGAVVQVPLFIKEGDQIKIDTRDHSYIERV